MIKWIRVTKRDRCLICSAPDWCGRSEDGKVAICMRVESSHTSKNGGWLHKLDSTAAPIRPIRPIEPPQPKLNVTKLMDEWRAATQPEWIEQLALELGVTADSLRVMDTVWAAEHRAWAWQMRDGHREPVGIRLRAKDGSKFAVKTSHQGLFLPDLRSKREIFIVEGVSDACAALSLGLFAIGRPSCLGCEQEINTFIRLNRVNRVIVCSDADGPGQRGSEKLQATLKIPSLIWTPFAKDMRECVKAGLTAQTLACITKDLIWTQPK